MIIHSCQIDGILCDLETTAHFLQRAQEANISLEFIAKILRKGGIDVHHTINNCIRVFVQNLEIVIDMISCSLVTIISTNTERKFQSSPTLGDVIKKKRT
jgi:hypothetical protein